MGGKDLRLARIMNPATGRTVIVPMDHGFSLGQLEGLRDMRSAIGRAVDGGADAVVLHRGMVRHFPPPAARCTGLIIHLSGGTSMSPDPDEKVPVCTVAEALALGADAVSVQLNLGAKTESTMIEMAGEVSRECRIHGVPLLIMCYPKGRAGGGDQVKAIGHCMRVAEELGADLIKTAYTGDPDSFAGLVEAVSVPVLVAGGEKGEEHGTLAMIRDAISAGASGVCMGRNAFQREDMVAFLNEVRRIVHGTTRSGDGVMVRQSPPAAAEARLR